MRNKVSMKSRLTRMVLSSVLTGTVMAATVVMQPMTDPAPVTPHDANEQAALKQQALERELQFLGLSL